ncbi:hypothetical protein BAE44_0007501, partial [Dichanthelium oligosanthes]
LEIRLVGNPRSRKEFSWFVVIKVVDSDTCNFKDFVDEIVEKYPPRCTEVVNVAYFNDATSKSHLEIKSDQDLLAMFAKHLGSKIVNIAIAYTLPTEIPEWPSASSLTTSQCTQSTYNQSTEPPFSQTTTKQPSPYQSSDDNDDDDDN